MKDSYRKEMSQIHAPKELLIKTIQAVVEEEKRNYQRKLRRKRIEIPIFISVAVILLIALFYQRRTS